MISLKATKARREKETKISACEDKKTRGIFGTILIVIGVFLLINSVALLFIANFNLSFILIFILSLSLIIYGINFQKFRKIKWLNICIAAIFVSFISLCSFLAIYGNSNNITYTEDAVIVLGSGIRGEVVTKTLANRLDKAAEYARKNPNAVIVVSGGQGPQEDIPEAEAMKKYLRMFLPDTTILEENQSHSTFENLTYSKEVLNEHFGRPSSTVIVTNDFHIYRAVQMSKQVGLDSAHLGAKTELYETFLNYSRECLAVLWLWVS